jgi:gamma-glutamyltranspeptidase/glutathione hydrolase
MGYESACGYGAFMSIDDGPGASKRSLTGAGRPDEPGPVRLDLAPGRSSWFAHAVVATSHQAAARAGVEVLRDGGSAVDAAITTAACLTVLEPTSNGLGGDAFALVWDGARLHGYNGSGRCPSRLDAETVWAAGLSEMPTHGWWSVTVPGQIRAWADLHERFGRLDWARLLAPAVDAAEHGQPVPPVIAAQWATGVAAARRRRGPEFAGFLDTFAAGGAAPMVGTSPVLAGHARTLRRLAWAGADDFYTGEIAHAITDFSAATGGALGPADLAAHRGEWVEPITIDYRGFTVAEPPPNGQGVAALQALGMLDRLDPDSGATPGVHAQVEAMKLAFADAFAHVGDPTAVTVPDLLDPSYVSARVRLIGTRAGHPGAGRPPGSGTVYLCVAAPDGQQVSFIQSNYAGFGSGVVVPGWGLALQNRGSGFVLDKGHPNRLAPGRRPFHTIIPGFLLRDGVAVGPFGVMGGHMRAQGHVQLVLRTVAGSDPQSALDAPRWRVEGERLLVEHGFDPAEVAELRGRGHAVTYDSDGFGRGQAIWRVADGWLAGSERRCDGAAVGW